MNDFMYSQYTCSYNQNSKEENKKHELLDKLSKFENIITLSEAKEEIKKIIPSLERYVNLYVADTSITVVNNKDSLRISIDSPEEFVCYEY